MKAKKIGCRIADKLRLGLKSGTFFSFRKLYHILILAVRPFPLEALGPVLT